jgi:hypothetical protein
MGALSADETGFVFRLGKQHEESPNDSVTLRIPGLRGFIEIAWRFR